jgi:precorrin-4 methylase
MDSWRRVGIVTLAAVALIGFAAVSSAHEVTYSGTVVAMETAKYAQPDGSSQDVQELEVTYIDETTKKPVQKVFTINSDTRLLRGDESVNLADAALEKGAKVEVVINHDTPGDIALEVRLPAGP